jgi:hypothetical protein
MIPTGADLTCMLCGRPVIENMVWGGAGPYHPECVRGPSALPAFHVPNTPFDATDIIRRLDELEKKMAHREDKCQ